MMTTNTQPEAKIEETIPVLKPPSIAYEKQRFIAIVKTAIIIPLKNTNENFFIDNFLFFGISLLPFYFSSLLAFNSSSISTK